MGEKVTAQQAGKATNFDPVRMAAVEALVLIERGDPIESAIAQVSQDRSFRLLDRRFFLQLVNGTTKLRRRLDHELMFYLAKPSITLPLILSNILRLGIFQLRFTDRVPPAAAVSEAVNLAHVMTDGRRAKLVNAVLRASLREPNKVIFANQKDEPVRYLADFYSFPDYFVEYCLKEFGYESTEQLLNRFNMPPKVSYRVNYLKAKPDEITKILEEQGVSYRVSSYLPEFINIQDQGLPLEKDLVASGKVYIQDESAGLAGRLLNPRPGTDVVDLTAAPGGKATHLAIRMRNKGRVTAVDKSRGRLELLTENAQRLGIKIISPVVADMMDFKGGPFDRVLLDPPCSGWGTAGRHSDLRWSKTPEDIANMTRIQFAMLTKAAKLVKPGGVLVYSTCTIMRAENDQIIEEFLVKNPDFMVDSAAEFFPPELVSERGFVKTYPDIGDMDGAFAARLKRKPM